MASLPLLCTVLLTVVCGLPFVDNISQDLFDRSHSRPLGTGAWSNVVSAVHIPSGAEVALKTPFNELADTSTELHFLRKLSECPNIIDLVGLVRENSKCSQPILVLEKADCNLREYIRDEKIKNDTEAKMIIYQAAAALKQMHLYNICHRDVKPTNLLVFEDHLEVVLSDLGLAEYCDKIDRIGRGTLEYFPPEVAKLALNKNATRDLDFKAVDMYALGITAYYVITRGKRPFYRHNGTEDADLAFMEELANLNQISNWPRVIRNDPAALDLFKGMLASDPGKRLSPQNVLEHPCAAAARSVQVNVQEEVLQRSQRQKILESRISVNDNSCLVGFGCQILNTIRRIGSGGALNQLLEEAPSEKTPFQSLDTSIFA
ncbi:MAG: hypothetical protein SGCHY_003438 [Lobulomycetales sp.]